ncbi:hypothetical protein P886_1786 [Alteromonadaceae bacterium 2753L.S.0a.02]|nr:hypothetical protein P886_1786 [Alteromonadaceae bacterium 2753L.S.0a.02]
MNVKIVVGLIVGAGLLAGCNQKNAQEETQESAKPLAEKVVPKAEVKTDVEVVEHTDKPGVTYNQVHTLTSEVLAVDLDTRTVILADSEGGPVEFEVGDEVRNLAQVSAGDKLSVEYLNTVNIELVPQAMQPMSAGTTETARAAEGEMPGAAQMNQTVDVFQVTEINIEDNTFKLKNSAGEENQYIARNPENLKKAKVGDSVVITTTEAMAIGVTKLAAE